MTSTSFYSSNAVPSGPLYLGVEFGSTRIKAVLIDSETHPVLSGGYSWENRFENGLWTYSMEDVWLGLQSSLREVSARWQERFGSAPLQLGGLGLSAMMHGYIACDENGELLVPFRTWRNTNTAQASEKLSSLFDFHIPQRWSVAHLYQAILNGEPHVPQVRYLTTLAGYVHWKLTGRRVLGIGDASGMFPIDSATQTYDSARLEKFNLLLREHGIAWNLEDILPTVLPAGAEAGTLRFESLSLLGSEPLLPAGLPLCPPEGDAGTGMVATNSVAPRTGNVSAGTSVFAMLVLDGPLAKNHPELDLVTTPSGKPVAMVHCNNCTSDLNAWVGLFTEFARSLGCETSNEEIFSLLFRQALQGDPDAGGLLNYNYLSGEHLTHFTAGRPLFVRTPESHFNLANFFRAQLFSSLATLKIGLQILQEENVALDSICGHGGFFKTPEVGARIMAAALGVPVREFATGGEGGAWGVALLAAYQARRETRETLESFLQEKVFHQLEQKITAPDPQDVEGFVRFTQRFQEGLPIQEAAVNCLN